MVVLGFKNADNNDVWVVNSSKEVLSEAELEHTVERDGKLYYAPFVSISLKDGRALTLNCKTEEQANNVALYIQSKLGDNYMGLTDVIDYFYPEKTAERENSDDFFEYEEDAKWYKKLFKKFTKKQV